MSPQPTAIRTKPREVYPYSVIRGGAYSREELNVALQADPLAKVHYANFDRGRTRVIRASTSSNVYVSFRKGNRILWTRRPVRLPEGEALLTDGTHLARARCGNRVSFTPPESAVAGEPGLDLDVPEPSTASSPELFAVPNMVHEIFPPLLTSAVPAGTGPAREALGPPAGGMMPMSTGGASSPGYTFPPASETTSPAPPSTGPIDFTLPVPPAWIAPSETVPLPPVIVITPTPGGTPPVPTWILPPYPTTNPTPGPVPVPTVGPTPEAPTTPETPQPPVPPGPPTPPTPPDTPTPEPSTVVLLLAGVALLAHRRIAARRGDQLS